MPFIELNPKKVTGFFRKKYQKILKSEFYDRHSLFQQQNPV